MAVSITSLKQQKLRKTFKIGDDTVEIYNITKDNKGIFDKAFEENLDYDTGEILLSDKALITAIYTTLTNIQFDSSDEVMDALVNPSAELEEINNELRLILTEFANSKVKEQLAKIKELEMLLNQMELTNKTNNLLDKTGATNKEGYEETRAELFAMRSSKKAGKGNAGKKAN